MGRISTCCEAKHQLGSWIGTKASGLQLVAVHGASPCMQCQVEAFALQNAAQTKPQRPTSARPASARVSRASTIARPAPQQESKLDLSKMKHTPSPPSFSATPVIATVSIAPTASEEQPSNTFAEESKPSPLQDNSTQEQSVPAPTAVDAPPQPDKEEAVKPAPVVISLGVVPADPEPAGEFADYYDEAEPQSESSTDAQSNIPSHDEGTSAEQV